MALVVKDRVKELTTTTGTSNLTLGGAVFGFQSFSVIGNGNTTYYGIYDSATGDWEVGVGTYSTTGPTLTRDTVLESSNAGSKVVFGAGSKDVFVTYPSERSVYLDAAGSAVTTLYIGTLGTSTANISTANITAGTISTTPTSSNDLVNKTYVDGIAAQGITYHTPVKYEVPNTTGNLTATYNNGASGVGATLTNAGTQTAFAPDGPTAQVGDRILVYNQTNAFENGVYEVSVVGSGSTNWVLTRAADADSYGLKDPNALGQGDAFYVTSGNTGAGETYVCNTAGTITFGTTTITFAQISSAQVYSAGTGLTLSNLVFSITPVGTAATYGSASNVPVFTTNASGQVTSVTNTAISITAGAVSGLAPSATTDTTNASNITSGTLGSARLTGSYTGITGVGTLTAGTWTATTIGAAYGGTGQTTYTVGDILYADGAASLAKLADVATGNALLSGGVGTAPAWGKIGLQTHVSGTLQVANGGTGATTLTGYVYGNGTGAFTASTSIPNSATTATSANTASAIVARDASGNFSAGTITASLSGNASTATSATSATTATNLAGGTAGAIPYQSGSGTTLFSAAGTSGQYLQSNGTSAPSWSTLPTIGNGTLTMAVAGTGLSGSATFTANQSGNTTFTVTSNATSGNTGSTIVARDGSGNFSAGTITASLSGNATTATTATTATNWGSYGAVPAACTSFGNANTIGRSDANGYTYFNYINSNTGNSENPTVSQVIVTNGSDNFYRKASVAHLTSSLSGTAPINITGSAGSTTGNAATATRVTGGNLTPAGTTFNNALISAGGSNRVVTFDGNGSTPSVWWSNGSRAYGAIDAQDPGLTFWANNGSSWQQQMALNYGNVTVNTDIRSPIFYDSNNTGYYLDPASTSELNKVYYNSNMVSRNYGIGQVGLYDSYRYQAVFSMGESYILPADGTTTGTLYGIAWSHPNAGGAASNLASHGMLILENGGFYGAWGGGRLVTVADIRGTIFYDYNNTGFYVDPASTTYLQTLILSGASYFRPSNWIQLEGNYGIYSSVYNGAHFQANISSSYGSWAIQGSRNGWGGIYDVYSGVNGIMYDSAGNGGVYREANGRWYLYYHLSNDCLGVGTSSTSSTYSLYLTKGVYAQSRIDATIYYDTNDTSYYMNPNSTSSLHSATCWSAWYFRSNVNTASGSSPPLQAYSDNGSGAIMAFHRGGYYAVNMGLDSDNVLRIGGWSASANLFQMDMSGNLTMAGNVTAYSDEKLKKDWADLSDNFIERLAAVKAGTYTRIDSGERQAGSSAQDWQELLPEVVSEDAAGTLALAYGNAAVVACVELAKSVVALRAEIKALRAQ